MILRLGGPHGRLAASGEFFKDHRMDPSERSPRSLRSLGTNLKTQQSLGLQIWLGEEEFAVGSIAV